MPPARLLVLAALGVLLGAGPILAQDSRQKQRQQQPARPDRAELLDLFDDAIVPQLRVEQVVRFGLRGDDLVVDTDIKPVHGVRQVRLSGFDGIAQIHVGQRPRGPMGLVPFYDFTYRGPAGPEGGSLQTNVTALSGGVRITRTHRLNDRHTTVRINQEPLNNRRGGGARPPTPRDSRVVLAVRVVTSANKLVDDLRVSAPSFDELLRRYPGPANEFVAPVFRELGQDAAVFGIDARVAWQLFPDTADADPALASKLMALLERLDAEDFAQREAAAAELEALGGPAVLVLADLDRESLSPEQNTRVDAFLAAYGQLEPAEVLTLLEDPQFLLRCFTYCDVPAARAAAVAALTRVLDRAALPDLDSAADRPARLSAADRLRAELAKSEP